jgi:hypothetical protein
VRGLRAIRDEEREAIPSPSVLCSRREHHGSDLRGVCGGRGAGPNANEQTPGAFWNGRCLLALDGTREATPDPWSTGQTLRSRTDNPVSQSLCLLTRVLLLVECTTHLSDAGEIRLCWQGKPAANDSCRNAGSGRDA